MRASAFLIAAGPVTAQDRWEENAGYSPSTLATIIAAFCAGAELSRAFGHIERADFTLAYADWLNSHVEDWCVTTVGERLPGKPRHYVRITPADPLAPDPHPDPNTLELTRSAHGGTTRWHAHGVDVLLARSESLGRRGKFPSVSPSPILASRHAVRLPYQLDSRKDAIA